MRSFDLKKAQKGESTVPSHSYISHFPLVYPETEVQDSYAPSEFPGAFL